MLVVIEKSRQDAPVFKVQDAHQQPLRSFIGLHEQCLSILGPRRLPCLPSAHQNTNSSLGISTLVGFASLELQDYIRATSLLKPDISISLADLYSTEKAGKKRVVKSADRTHAWLRDTLSVDNGNSETFASVLSIEKEQQSFYLCDLGDEYASQISGLCLYQPETTEVLPQGLDDKARLCLSEPKTPHDLLRAVALGVDMITIPFVTSTSEAGIAFDFIFKQDSPGVRQDKASLGVDMWSTTHATDTSALSQDCQCYACKRHHRAYVHHCLQAREMLAWTLLQVHNFHVIHNFFIQIRQSIADGTFDADTRMFEQTYESSLPQNNGEGPRVRGYQMRSVGGGEPKKNPKAYGRLDEQARKIEEAESGVPTPTVDEDSQALEEHGFAQKI